MDIGRLLATIDNALSSKSSVQLSEISDAAKRIAMLEPKRERQVLSGLLAGGTNKMIAAGDLGIVIAHPGKAGSCSGIFVASTKRSTSSTGARLAFAVLTRERNAA